MNVLNFEYVYALRGEVFVSLQYLAQLLCRIGLYSHSVDFLGLVLITQILYYNSVMFNKIKTSQTEYF